jgi:hypothetical protein
MRSFLFHVLSHRLVRIRHYGLLANSVRKERLALCRERLGVRNEPPVAPAPEERWEQRLLKHTGRDVTTCPLCKRGRLVTTQVVDAADVPYDVEARAASP